LRIIFRGEHYRLNPAPLVFVLTRYPISGDNVVMRKVSRVWQDMEGILTKFGKRGRLTFMSRPAGVD
jgi:hypothetical protein